MSLFLSNSCAAFVWDNEDRLVGVLVERAGHEAVVKNIWHGERAGNRSHAELLGQAGRELPIAEETTVIIGGNPEKTCFVDLKLPKIAAGDLRRALEFELTKHTPLPIDSLQWGYRVIGKIAGTELQLVRIAFFLQEDWESWVSAASGISGGVDMIIPPVTILDPLVTGKDVCLAVNGSLERYQFHSVESGERVITCHPADQPAGDVFGIGDQPLRQAGFNLGPLAPLPAAEQRRYTAPALLAWYGLSDATIQDHRHWLSVPTGLRPKRNRAHKIYVTFVAVYLLFVSGVLVSSWFYDKYRQYNSADAEYRRLKADVDRFQEGDGSEAFATQVETEIMAARGSLLSMTEALLEVTEITGSKVWSKKFDWNAGTLGLELSSEVDDSDVTLQFQNSPILTDVTMRKTQRANEPVKYIVDCRVKALSERTAGVERTQKPNEPPAEAKATDEMAADAAAPTDKENGAAEKAADAADSDTAPARPAEETSEDRNE